MEGKRIYLASPHMSDEGYEREYVKEAFDTNWIAPLGNNVNCFETELADVTGARATAALSSGTAAIHLAIKAAGIKPGDVVLCQSLTFSATCNPIIYEGATPVFIDSEAETWNLSPDALRKAFKKYPNARAVIAVHLYGTPAKLDEIQSICKENNAILIEDACESLGSVYKSKLTGSIGELAAFSFNGNKIITTSGGGMFVSNRECAAEDARTVKFWATQSRDDFPYYQHSQLGYNYRMSNVLAGIGRGQLRVLKKRVDKKREIFDTYKMHLAGQDGVSFLSFADGVLPNNWLSCMLSTRVAPESIIEALAEKNIEARHIWKPMHLQPYFEKYDYISDGDVSEYVFAHGICLPSDTKMTAEEQELVISIIKGLWE